MSDNFGENFEEIRIGARAEYPPPKKKKSTALYTQKLNDILEGSLWCWLQRKIKNTYIETL